MAERRPTHHDEHARLTGTDATVEWESDGGTGPQHRTAGWRAASGAAHLEAAGAAEAYGRAERQTGATPDR